MPDLRGAIIVQGMGRNGKLNLLLKQHDGGETIPIQIQVKATGIERNVSYEGNKSHRSWEFLAFQSLEYC